MANTTLTRTVITYQVIDPATNELLAATSNIAELYEIVTAMRADGLTVEVRECRVIDLNERWPHDLSMGRYTNDRATLELLNNLTPGERTMLRAHFRIAYEGCYADNVGALLADNYSWAYVKDFTRLTRFTTAQVKGYLGSLTKKGIVVKHEELNLHSISEDFLRALYLETDFTAHDFLS